LAMYWTPRAPAPHPQIAKGRRTLADGPVHYTSVPGSLAMNQKTWWGGSPGLQCQGCSAVDSHTLSGHWRGKHCGGSGLEFLGQRKARRPHLRMASLALSRALLSVPSTRWGSGFPPGHPQVRCLGLETIP
jgi:hypothetical protein